MAIRGELASRRARFGEVRRLTSSVRDIHAYVAASLEAATGIWVTGVHGAVAVFARDVDEHVEIAQTKTAISARTARAAVAFDLPERVCAFAFRLTPQAEAADFVVLAVPQSLGFPEPPRGLCRLGPDTDAVAVEHRDEPLYDFGLGSAAARFCLRAGTPSLAQTLDRLVGCQWPVFFPAILDDLSKDAPTRVVRSPLGRIEVFTPRWSESATDSPHTHFLPWSLTSEDVGKASGMADCYLPCAVHYPRR